MNMLSPIEVERRLVPAAEPAAFDWLPLTGVFLRRRLPMALAAAFSLAMLVFVFVSQEADTFTANTTLLVDQRRTDGFQSARSQSDMQGINAQIESQVEVLRSFGLAQLVVDRLNLADTAHDQPSGSGLIGKGGVKRTSWLGFGSALGDLPDDATSRTQAAMTLSRMISVRRVGLTYVIDVSVVAHSPTAAAKLANALVGVYIAEQLAAKSQAMRETGDWLHTRIVELSAQAKNADEAVQSYRRDHHIVATDEALISEQQLTGLAGKLSGLSAATTAAAAELERTRMMLGGGDASGRVMGDGLQSGIADNLRQKLIDKQRQYSEWKTRFGLQHEVVRRLQSEIDELQGGIRGELQRIVSTATNSLEIARANERAAQARVTAAVDQSGRVSDERVQLRELQSQADTYRALSASFLQRYTQATQDQSFPVSDIQVVSAATPPLLKSGPKRGLLVGGSIVVGLGLGLIAGLVAEMSAARAGPAKHCSGRSARGLECLATLPMLVSAPAGLRSLAAKLCRLLLGRTLPEAQAYPDDDPATLLRLGIAHPHQTFGLAIGALRRRILERTGGTREGRVIGCLTLNGGDGTTTVAANLAHALATGGHRTVLVDMADGPNSLTRLMERSVRGGDGFAGQIHQDRQSGLLFRPVHHASGGGAGMSQSPVELTMSAAIKALQRKHDFVIIDLPAVERRMPSHDILMDVDDLLMVGRWTEQDEASLLEVPDLAAASAVRCLGIVLTMVPLRLCDVK